MMKSYITTAFRSLTRNKEYSLINILGLAISITSCLILFIVLRFEMSFDDFHSNEKLIYRIVMDFKYPEGDIHTPGIQGPAPEAFRTDFTQLNKIATIFSIPNSQIDVLKGGVQNSENRFKEEKGVLFAEPEHLDIYHFNFNYWAHSSAYLKLAIH